MTAPVSRAALHELEQALNRAADACHHVRLATGLQEEEDIEPALQLVESRIADYRKESAT